VAGGCVAHLLIGLVLVAVASALYALHYLLKPAIVQIVVYVVETIVELFGHLSESHARYCCVSCMARDIFAFQVAIPNLLRIGLIGLQSTRLGHFLIPFGKLIKALDSWYML
jgi:chromate transport protein ChrA